MALKDSLIYNSAGAYWDVWSVLNIGNSTDSCGNYGTNTTSGGHDEGLCSDLFSRIPPGMGTWAPYKDYPVHTNQTALKKTCAGCMMQSWIQHYSYEGCNPDGSENEPCKCSLGSKGMLTSPLIHWPDEWVSRVVTPTLPVEDEGLWRTNRSLFRQACLIMGVYNSSGAYL